MSVIESIRKEGTFGYPTCLALSLTVQGKLGIQKFLLSSGYNVHTVVNSRRPGCVVTFWDKIWNEDGSSSLK
jgi:hypothetical protein